MHRLRNSILGLLLAALCLAQSASELAAPEIRRVGQHLACLCGTCRNTVADCQMLHCGYALPAREKIARMLGEGKSDQEIIDSFVAERGIHALAVPPAEGFNILGWIMPFVAILGGLLAIWWFIRRFLAKSAPAAVPANQALLDKYQQQINKDLSTLDG